MPGAHLLLDVQEGSIQKCDQAYLVPATLSKVDKFNHHAYYNFPNKLLAYMLMEPSFSGTMSGAFLSSALEAFLPGIPFYTSTLIQHLTVSRLELKSIMK